MDCRETQDLIHGYIDGELDLGRSLEIERHLGQCESCSQIYNAHRAVRSVIREKAQYFAAPAGFEGRVRSALGEARRPAVRPARTAFAWRWGAVAASIAVAAVLGWTVARTPPRLTADDRVAEQVISSHVRSLMPGHLADVQSSDQHTVKPWFNGKLDFSPAVNDLASYGFPLSGGRLDYLDGRPVAALVYQRRQHLINLFIWPSPHRADAATQKLARQGYHVIYWDRSGMTYWAVSDLNPVELEEFVRLIQK